MSETKPKLDWTAYTAGLLTPLLAAGVALTALPGLLVSAWAVSLIWAWYLVALIAAPPMPFAAAFGLVLIGRLMRGPPHDPKGTPAPAFWPAMARSLLMPVVMVFLAWLGTLFL